MTRETYNKIASLLNERDKLQELNEELKGILYFDMVLLNGFNYGVHGKPVEYIKDYYIKRLIEVEQELRELGYYD